MAISRYAVFCKIISCGSFTEAAEQLGCTQSNITHIVNNLEAEYGFTLLKRNRGGISLTPEGARMLPFMQSAASAEENAAKTAEMIRREAGGEIRVGAFSSVSVHWMPGIINDYRRENPGVEFKLLSGDYHDIDRLLSDGKIDIAFVTEDTVPNCRVIPIAEDPILAVLPIGHPLSGNESISPSEIKDENLICLPETSDSDSRQVFERAGYKPNIRFTTKDDYAIIAMVAGGLGISLMPQLLLQGHSENVVMLPLDPPATRIISIAIPDRCESSRCITAFADFVIKHMKTK